MSKTAQLAEEQAIQSALLAITPEDEPTAFSKVLPHSKKRSFLLAYAELGSQVAACRVALCSRPALYYWLRDDPDFAAAYQEARMIAGDKLESAAFERATREHFPSDTLLIFLLKALKPERYRENSRIELTGANGGPVQLQAGKLSDAELLLAEKLARKMLASAPAPEPPAIETTAEVVAEPEPGASDS